MTRDLESTSRFLSYVLRHDPDALGLELDPGGWADVDTLVRRARAQGRALSRDRIERVIRASDKERFTLSGDGQRIRANYGHSIDVDLELEPVAPPEELYHGTARRTLPAIRREGLQPRSRQYVHLSTDRASAVDVGRRHGTPVVLRVHAARLYADGAPFYRSTGAVWLTPEVPPTYIAFPEV